MAYDHRKCEDEDDATRMAETILRTLGYNNLQLGSNSYNVRDTPSPTQLQSIAVNAERIARWARGQLRT